MKRSALLIGLNLIYLSISEEINLPRIQVQGNVPTLTRADAGLSARSRSCFNGTEFIVTFSDLSSTQESLNILNKHLGSDSFNHCRALQHPDRPEAQLNALTVCIPPGKDVDAHLEVILGMEGVEAVEENLVVNLLYVPWHLDRIDQVNLPLDGRYVPEGTGSGVRVYLTDTGTDYTHPEFEGRVMAGYSAVNGQSATRDMGNHGTHTAGIVGSRTYGVAKEVTIVPVKVFSDLGGGATGADIVEGINWVISQERAYSTSAVMSMSLGMPGSFYAGDQALLRAVQSGVIPVVAAGNDGTNACNYWPAGSASAITVGATDSRDYRSSFSNYGSCVDLYAPGSSITSTLPNDRVGIMSGTSMACPVVSGVTALYLEKHPEAQLEEMRRALSRNAVGNRRDPPSKRMLLVQANEDTTWSLTANTNAAVQATTIKSNEAGWVTYFVMVMSTGCLFSAIAFMIASSSSKQTAKHQDPMTVVLG